MFADLMNGVLGDILKWAAVLVFACFMYAFLHVWFLMVLNMFKNDK